MNGGVNGGMTVAMTERALAARNFIKARERWHWAEALPWLLARLDEITQDQEEPA